MNVSLINQDMQINTSLDNNIYPPDSQKWKFLIIPSFGKIMEQCFIYVWDVVIYMINLLFQKIQLFIIMEAILKKIRKYKQVKRIKTNQNHI